MSGAEKIILSQILSQGSVDFTETDKILNALSFNIISTKSNLMEFFNNLFIEICYIMYFRLEMLIY